MKKYKVGYTQGSFDLFHIGHLNILQRAKEQCEYLIVGVNSDRLVEEYKNKTPIINEQDRVSIVEAIKYVDNAIIVDTLDKVETLQKVKFDVIFIGSDWKGNERWERTIDELKAYNVDVIFLPHTDRISSTMIRGKLK